MNIKSILLWVSLTAELLAVLCVLAGLLRPRQRIWPPARPGDRKSRLMQGLFILSGSGVAALGLLDWGSWPLPPWVRLGIGLPLWAGGIALAAWAMAVLGRQATWGGEGNLIVKGPYRFSRNPQYLGFMLGLCGWALLSASRMAGAAALAGLLPLGLVPFSEEPWLAERYGNAYTEYCRKTARFLRIHKGPVH